MVKNSQYLLKAILLCASVFFCSLNTYAQTQNANHLVSGILSYVRWDPEIQQINFCIIDGESTFISRDIFTPLSQPIYPPNVKIFQYTAEQLLRNSEQRRLCNVYYFAKTTDNTQQQIINQSKTKILTIAENNNECAIGSSFCIYRAESGIKFKVNLDSLKASQIRVNPKVLFLFQSQGEKE